MVRYTIDRIFAEGAQGRLYRAQDKVTNQICILKTGDSVKREALLALELNHPYIARPFDYGVDPQIGAYAAYLEYTDPSLLEWIEKKPKENDLRRVAIQIAEFLAFIHHRGWLYNDFKPGHFLISEQDIRVLDLGLISRIDESSGTFSGTFPYIAPERLAGRASDVRSDIFAFGMLLLHALVPNENWNYEPSIAILHELQKRTGNLHAFWKELLSEMLSLEASQRIETAGELWKRLQPSPNGNLLFFPFPPYFSANDSINKERGVIVRSESRIALRAFENTALVYNWEKNIQTIIYDLRMQNLEYCVISLCQIFLKEAPSDFFLAVESLCNLKQTLNSLVIFRSPEFLPSQQKSLYSYTLSALLRRSHFNILVTTNREEEDIGQDVIKVFDLPLLTKRDVDQILPLVLPSNGNSRRYIKKLHERNFSTPEQVLNEFRGDLVTEQYVIWPAAARDYFSTSIIRTLRPVEMRVLGCLAIWGGSLHKDVLFSVLNISATQGDLIVRKLESEGYIQRQNGDQYSPNIANDVILNRLRKDRTQKIADSLLRIWSKDFGLETGYRIAIFAKNSRAAAFLAIAVARSLPKSGKSEIAGDWYWKAFSSGAKFPKRMLFDLVNYCLLRVQISRIRRLLVHIKKRFGKSFELLKVTLDLFQRTNRFTDAIQLSQLGVSIASRKNNQFAKDYFSARLAGFLILGFQLDEGERVLTEIFQCESAMASENILGMAHHFRGLSYLYRGRFDAAVDQIRIAISKKHQFRASSLMNLGVAYFRLGQPERAERFLRSAVAIFIRYNDIDRLCFAYTNLGIAIKQLGKVKEARNYYFHALHLSNICKNVNVKLSILANIGIAYELEGRTAHAIRAHTKAAKIAKKNHFRVQMGIALINAGNQYSIVGKYRSAVSRLTHALEIVRSSDLQFEVGSAYESLGFAYLLSKHYRKAVESFTHSLTYFSKAGAQKDFRRSEIYLALALAEDGNHQSVHERINATKIPKDSFEDGLSKYTLAYSALRSNEPNNEQCRDWIHQAEAIFRKIPSLFWLGKVQKLKAQYLLETDHFEKANISLQSAYNIFSRLGAKKELMNLSKGSAISKMPEDFVNRMAERLPYKILLMIKEVLSEPDPDKMITKILSASLEFTDMERAVLILKEDPPKIFKSALLDESSVREIYDISNSAMDEATDTKKPYVRLDAVSDPYLKSKPSILASRIMSIVCLPLRANDKPIGVLYLDSREGVETLASTETVLLEIFASIISLALNNSLILERSIAENEGLRSSLGLIQFPEIIGKSEVMMKVLKTVTQLLPTELPVLITGETGTGKEMIARVLHFSGKRRNGSFLAVNCSAFSKDLLESELFGHEKGSFTGAIALKKGLFEQARGGTLFLDEIGEMDYSMQAKLLRVLQEGEFRRVGGNETLHADVRLVLATNRNLPEMVKQEKFREDLFYRIKGAQVHLPPLRERSQDIPLLIASFLGAANKGTGKNVAGFAPETLELLKKYSWPGNIRQLKNEVERVVALTQNEWIQPEDLDEEVRETRPSDVLQKGTLREREKQIIIDSLEYHKWNIVQTAKTLGLTRNGLYGKMKLHGIPRKSVE